MSGHAGSTRDGAERPLVIGIAGGIASGKSRAAKVLGKLGCLVLDADAQVKALLQSPEIQRKLVGWWGEGVIQGDGKVDRGAIAQIVFNDEDERKKLEALLHPIVIAEQREAIRSADPATIPAVVLDVPLLFESGMDKDCDAVIFVETSQRYREQRVRERRGWPDGELARREANQMPLAEKKAGSGFVVMNDGDLADLEDQVRAVFDRITAQR